MSQTEEYPSQFRGLWRSSEARPSLDCLSIHPGLSSEAEAQPPVLRGQSVLQRLIRPQMPVMHPQKPVHPCSPQSPESQGPSVLGRLVHPQRPSILSGSVCPAEAWLSFGGPAVKLEAYPVF